MNNTDAFYNKNIRLSSLYRRRNCAGNPLLYLETRTILIRGDFELHNRNIPG